MPTPGWWREYRRTHRAEITAATRRRRQSSPVLRAQRLASEQRRRARLRAEDAARAVPMDHPLLAAAAALVPMPAPGGALRFANELMAEDARSEAVVAMLAGTDPLAAVHAWRSAERAWQSLIVPLADEPRERV